MGSVDGDTLTERDEVVDAGETTLEVRVVSQTSRPPKLVRTRGVRRDVPVVGITRSANIAALVGRDKVPGKDYADITERVRVVGIVRETFQKWLQAQGQMAGEVKRTDIAARVAIATFNKLHFTFLELSTAREAWADGLATGVFDFLFSSDRRGATTI
ncbi:uncharacterized protein PITG_11955 [Phytophthora infestans T30-4]|uniref:Uncharacterized protein n=2 Tax=Phytophthora infestans TaxID=4787 RepID=D0NHL7_PHYIT|nr:uncharacterized protein PITG_11955 [Phytophthora infestans T30-4]EEY58942.1 conserved hypothetical protein [Phytophthora infestans T30-4]|eukprot:XP_002901415.1 conserved hypothetical protein [Phytophthora infestans T30-4]